MCERITLVGLWRGDMDRGREHNKGEEGDRGIYRSRGGREEERGGGSERM